MIKINSNILERVKYILSNYGEHIHNDKQLVLLYWKIIDGVDMDKTSISTKDYLNKATPEKYILNTKMLLESIE